MRLPRIASAAGQLIKELQWLPRLAAYLPVPIPIPLGEGLPPEGYPWLWSIYRWLDGENATTVRIVDGSQMATALSQFVTAMQQIDPTNGPVSQRGCSLVLGDDETRVALGSLHGIIDLSDAAKAW